jgi:hypothetical protein
MPVEVVFERAGNVTNMTDAAKAQLQAAIDAAERAGVAKVVVTGAREDGHRSHLPRGDAPGTEWDFYGVNADGTLWSREQRVYAAEGARAAGANRFGFYERPNGQFDPMLHIGQSRPGFDQAIWGRNHQYGGASSRSFQNPAEKAFTTAAYPRGLDQYPSFQRTALAPWQGGGGTQQAFAPEAGLTPGQQAVSAMAAGGVPIPKAKPSSGASSLPRLQGGGAKTVSQIGADLNKPIQMGNVGRGPETSQEGRGNAGWMVTAANAFLRNQASPFDAPRAAQQIGGAVGSGVNTAAKSVGDTIGKFAGSFNGQSSPTTRAYAPTEQSGPPQNKQDLIARLVKTEDFQPISRAPNSPANYSQRGWMAGPMGDVFPTSAGPMVPSAYLGDNGPGYSSGFDSRPGRAPGAQSSSSQLMRPSLPADAFSPYASAVRPQGAPTITDVQTQRLAPAGPAVPNAGQNIQNALAEQQMMRGGAAALPQMGTGGTSAPSPLPTVPVPQARPPAQPSIAQGITAGALIQSQLPQLPTTGGATGATMLSRGMKDSEPVAAIQAALNRAGFDSGPTDGDFGPITDLAVRDFQRSKGLEEDGIVGPKTLAAIDKLERLGKGGGDEPKTFRKSEDGSTSTKGGGFDLWGSLTDLFGTGPR